VTAAGPHRAAASPHHAAASPHHAATSAPWPRRPDTAAATPGQ